MINTNFIKTFPFFFYLIKNIYFAGQTGNDLNGYENNGSVDIFLKVFDEDGNELWAKLYGTEKPDVIKSIIFDDKDNIFIAGYTIGAFEGKENGNSDCSLELSLNCEDIFFLKLNPDGDVVHTEQYGSDHHDAAKAMAFDSKGNLFVVGYTRGELDGNSFTVNYCDPYPCSDVFLSKFDNKLNKLWTKTYGTEGENYAESIYISSDDEIYLAGRYLRIIDNDGVEGWSGPFASPAIFENTDSIYALGSKYLKTSDDNIPMDTLDNDYTWYTDIALDRVNNRFVITGASRVDPWFCGAEPEQYDTFLKVWDKDIVDQ